MSSAIIARVLFFIAMFFITTLTPAARVENPYLVQAFAALGVQLFDRKSLFSKYLDQCYTYYRSAFETELSLYNGTYQIATDGWKKKAAERGMLQPSQVLCGDMSNRQAGVTTA